MKRFAPAIILSAAISQVAFSVDMNKVLTPDTGGYSLRDFQYDTDSSLLLEVADHIGCEDAADLVIFPKTGVLGFAIERILNSTNPFREAQRVLRTSRFGKKACYNARGNLSPQKSATSNFIKLVEKHKDEGFGLTIFVMNGFGGHEAPEVFTEPFTAWDKAIASRPDLKNYFRRLNSPCLPDGYASDEKCHLSAAKKFGELEAAADDSGIEHRYLFIGYSKGGNTFLRALAENKTMRDKSLGLLTLGSPLSGGYIISPVLNLVRVIRSGFQSLPSSVKNLIGNLLAATSGSGADIGIAMIERMTANEKFKVLEEGGTELFPSMKKNYMESKFRKYRFDREVDPVFGNLKLPLFQIAGLGQADRLNGIPKLKLGESGKLVADKSQYLWRHTAILGFTPFVSHYPLTDMCVALQHAVVPKHIAEETGLDAKLLGVLKADHVQFSFNGNTVNGKRYPSAVILDSVLGTIMKSLGANP